MTLGQPICVIRTFPLNFIKPITTLAKVSAVICALHITGCASFNHPSCSLPSNVEPLRPAHASPYTPEPWVSFDGSRFPYSKWSATPPSRAKAIVILVPGWDGSMTDYSVLAEHLVAHGYIVYGSEQRTGVYDPKATRRGNPAKWNEWVRDLQSFTTFIASKHPHLPIFYHGHSFGTLVVLQTAAAKQESKPLRGIILQSAAMPFLIERENSVKGAFVSAFSWWRVAHLRLIESTNRGPTGSKVLNCQWLRSPDRLSEGYKVRYFLQAAKLGHQARLSSRCLQLPVLALEGQKDSVVAPNPDDKEAYDDYLRHELRGGKAQVISYPDGYHTMTIAPTGDPAIDHTTKKALLDITRWLDRETNVKPIHNSNGVVAELPLL